MVCAISSFLLVIYDVCAAAHGLEANLEAEKHGTSREGVKSIWSCQKNIMVMM